MLKGEHSLAWSPGGALKEGETNLRIRRGNDPRIASGSERVPRIHIHLEQEEWLAGTVLGSKSGNQLLQNPST